MTVVTRFAPSPTGYLHIGGARTALFNYLFARHHQGKFLLRIEDTDKARSTQAAIDALLSGLKWLGLQWDEQETYQSHRALRHAEVAQELVALGKAYYCYTQPEELQAFRQANPHAKFRSVWRNTPPQHAPEGIKGVIRIKAPEVGEIVIDDAVQGKVRVAAEQLDDMVLLRSDGSPTYMLAVVVDDHDAGVTHIIRGDDHLTNAARQLMLYHAMDWIPPVFAHIPLIHGPDGAKLSKRHGALGVEEYEAMGFLPEAMRNYLLRLGWSHGDDEIISDAQAIAWFDMAGIGKSPARLDFNKMKNLNGHYIRESQNERLFNLVFSDADNLARQRLLAAMDGLKQRAKTLIELREAAAVYLINPEPDEKAAEILASDTLLPNLVNLYEAQNDWSKDALQECAKRFGEARSIKLGDVAAPLRTALTGRTVSQSVFEIMAILGQNETLSRLKKAIKQV